MAIEQIGSLQAYQFDLFMIPGLIHGVFTRHGGISVEPWQSLNQGGTVGDERDHVIENRRRIFDACARPVNSIFDVWQVHSADVVCADQPRPLDSPHQKADGIITNRPDVTLFMRFADCVPILLFDPIHRVIGLVHAGWKGTVNKAAAVAVEAMKNQYGCKPGDIRAGIGPSIGPDHYPVGPEVIEEVMKNFPDRHTRLLENRDENVHFDLWETNRTILVDSGVNQIQVAGVCTACHVTDWFSHRAEHGKTGRFGVLMALSGGASAE